MANPIKNPTLRSETLRFSLPIIAELFLMSLISMANLALVGHLGAAALSAVGLSSQPVAISLVFFQSVSIGATALIARAVGGQNFTDAQNLVYQTLYLSIFLGAFVGIGTFIWARPLVLLMGAKPDSLESAIIYIRFMAVGMVFQAIPTGVTAILRGAGDSRSPMLYNIITNVTNVIFGLIFIHGLWGFPALGIWGAGLATTLAKAMNTILALRALFFTPLPLKFTRSRFPGIDRKALKRILDIGISSAGEGLAMRVGFLIYSRIIADLGTVSFAAHQIILSATQVGSNLVQGLSAAAGSFTGRSLGAGSPDLAIRYNRILWEFGLAASTIMGFIFFFFGKYVAGFFTQDPEVIYLTGRVLKTAALITLPQNFLSILSGALRGAGDTRWPLYSALSGMLIARTGLSFVFVLILGWGLQGAWLAALADQTIRALFICYRYRTEKWIYASL